MTSRRSVLVGTLAGTAALLGGTTLIGCSGDPTSTPTPGATGRVSGTPRATVAPAAPTPDATATRYATVERRLLARADAVSRHAGYSDLSAARKKLLVAVRDGHRQHLAALTGPEPTSRPLPSASTTPSASAVGGKLTNALDELASAEQAAVAGYATTAAKASGFASLLYASLAAAAQGYATAVDGLLDDDPAAPFGGTTRPELAPWTETQAEQNLLAAAHAMLYGYKAALGFISETSGTGKRMLARLADYHLLRDRLIQLVIAGDQEPVAAEPAYELPVRVTGTASATDLARRLELAVQPHLGRFVAAATTPAVHRIALDQLEQATGSALSWGAGVSAWPGWPR